VDFEELEKVIDSFDDIFKNSLQKKALMMFMMYVPLRKSDVVRLKRSQFDLDNGYLRFIVKKTDNEIKIPIVSVIIPVLQLYFMKESEKNNAFNTSIPAINYLFRQIKEWHNIDVTPHMTRSTFAVWYLQSRNTSSALKELQQILGHRSIETTSRYCRLLPQDLKEGMESVFKNRKKNKKR
jgi:integrase